MALQGTDLLVIHRPGPGAGSLFNCPVKDFIVDNSLATEDEAGIVRFATVTEVIEGVNNQLAISPLNLAEAFDSPRYVFDGNSISGDTDYDDFQNTFVVNSAPLGTPASETEAGEVRLATTAETTAGTANDIAITPAGLRGMLNDPAYEFDVGATVIDANNFDYI